MFPLGSKCKVCVGTSLVLLVVGVVILILYFPKKGESTNNDRSRQFYRNTVVSNGPECATIGMRIIREHNGTAVDAAIATLFCEGVTICQSMGLGGGFFATIYTNSSKKIETLIARERAPLAASKNMFANETTVTGIRSVAVPGELRGYFELHRKYGRVSWKTLVQPTIDLCRSGHIVTEYLARVLELKRTLIFAEPSLREVFVNSATNDLWKAGDRIRRLKLAETLAIIANEGADTMYTANGTIAKLLVQEIQELGGLITMEDFVKYETEWKKPVSTQLKGNYSVHSVGLPSSGLILILILNMINGFKPEHSVDFYHQMVESFKFGYAKRTNLGDLPFNQTFLNEFSDMNYADGLRKQIDLNKTFDDPIHYGAEYATLEDHGTAHVSVLAENGDAISITSSINSIFGSTIRSKSTGIILNDSMDDFSSPGIKNGFGYQPSPANFIKPQGRPLSSMCPTIVLNENKNVVFVAGSAGGSKIISTVANVFIKHFWMNQTLSGAVSSKRIHHQLLPMEINHENGFSAEIFEGLRTKGHSTKEDKGVFGFAAVTAISRSKGLIEAVFDPRRFGSVAIN